jgi:hypothetical protein
MPLACQPFDVYPNAKFACRCCHRLDSVQCIPHAPIQPTTHPYGLKHHRHRGKEGSRGFANFREASRSHPKASKEERNIDALRGLFFPYFRTVETLVLSCVF